jgi:hypothetical protein
LVPRTRLAANAALVALIPVALVSPILVLLALTSAVVVAVAWSSSRTHTSAVAVLGEDRLAAY